jgi:hypothetical protein
METRIHSDRVSLFLFGSPWHVTCNAWRVAWKNRQRRAAIYFIFTAARAELSERERLMRMECDEVTRVSRQREMTTKSQPCLTLIVYMRMRAPSTNTFTQLGDCWVRKQSQSPLWSGAKKIAWRQ